jgi:hypothetical protein
LFLVVRGSDGGDLWRHGSWVRRGAEVGRFRGCGIFGVG